MSLCKPGYLKLRDARPNEIYVDPNQASHVLRRFWIAFSCYGSYITPVEEVSKSNGQWA